MNARALILNPASTERRHSVFQPEASLIFASLENDPYRLVKAWPSNLLARDLLDGMANMWGIDLDEPDFG